MGPNGGICEVSIHVYIPWWQPFHSAKRSGLDLTAFWHAIRASAGNSFTWETAAPNVFAGDYHKFFDMGLQTKDIQLMADIAKASNVSFIKMIICIYNFSERLLLSLEYLCHYTVKSAQWLN